MPSVVGNSRTNAPLLHHVGKAKAATGGRGRELGGRCADKRSKFPWHLKTQSPVYSALSGPGLRPMPKIDEKKRRMTTTPTEQATDKSPWAQRYLQFLGVEHPAPSLAALTPL